MLDWLKSAKINFFRFLFFFLKPRLFFDVVIRQGNLKNLLVLTAWIVFPVFLIQSATSHFLRNAGVGSPYEVLFCQAEDVEEFMKQPEIKEFISSREQAASSGENFPHFMGVKFYGKALAVATGNEDLDRANDRVLEFGIYAGVAAIQQCFFEPDVPQLALLKMGFSSILFDEVRPADLDGPTFFIVYAMAFSFSFAFSIFVLSRLFGVAAKLSDIFKVTLSSYIIWSCCSRIIMTLSFIVFWNEPSDYLRYGMFDWLKSNFLLIYIFSAVVLILNIYYYLKAMPVGFFASMALFGASVVLVGFLGVAIILPALYLLFYMGFWINLLF
ncbi:hypothetical protein RE428_07310 [Marinobacter nanhaiticus D15-8W]|uniref:hypothetical protein n=1 Tax=Marinobacter nanhaiticus TaxID=1305740 RepID=UPI002920FBDF|nr:hypothetical protein RE428_07310 [Marinobacter nanhaiticus D15-8W]